MNGRPSATGPIVDLLRAYYAKPGNGAGGVLHIVTDDSNSDGDSVAFCRQLAAERGDSDALAICDILEKMSPTARRKLQRTYAYGSTT